MKGDQSINHGGHGHRCEQACANPTDTVAEVEEANCETAEDDGEVEPGDESPLVGEEDFGFHTRREGDAFSWRRGLVSGMTGEGPAGERGKRGGGNLGRNGGRKQRQQHLTRKDGP